MSSDAGSAAPAMAAIFASGLALGCTAALLLAGVPEPPPVRLPVSAKRRGAAGRKRVDDYCDGTPTSVAASGRGGPLKLSMPGAAAEADELYGISTGFSMEEARVRATEGKTNAQSKTPAEVLTELQKGNARFWTGSARRPEVSAFERRALISTQYPSAAILGCSDSRVPVEIVFDQGLGDLFVIRVAGNCLDTTTTASLQYAVHHLGVKVLIVMGHEGCGAIKASQLPSDAISKEPECLGELLTGLKSGLDQQKLMPMSDTRASDRESVTANVRHQVEKLADDAGVMGKVEKGELLLLGAFYEISSGIVDFFHEVDAQTDAGGEMAKQPSKGVQSRHQSKKKTGGANGKEK